jgi:hypothetical protein
MLLVYHIEPRNEVRLDFPRTIREKNRVFFHDHAERHVTGRPALDRIGFSLGEP